MANTIGSYLVRETLHESSVSRIYRAEPCGGGASVILKLLHCAAYGDPELARFQAEYAIAAALSCDGVIRTLRLESLPEGSATVAEDIGGESLDRWLLRRRLTLEECLAVAIQVAHGMRVLHEAGITHGSLNPANIVWNPLTGRAQVIDFGTASRPSTGTPADGQLKHGPLPYISPEQTGRTGLALDQRTDFYSLGITLYEIVTGQLPFTAQDSAEMVHAHLAGKVLPPNKFSAAIPEPVSGIVMKLVAKNPDERYQSMRGLESDLLCCQAQLKANGRIDPFAIGRDDSSSMLGTSRRLYGREAETKALSQAYAQAKAGAAGLVLVAGHSGLGKTAQVQQLQKSLHGEGGSFITGKYAQFSRGIPYSGIVSAFACLVSQLLAEPESRLEEWREQLHSALGGNGSILVDLIPDLGYILGVLPPALPLPPIEAQNRLCLLCCKFLRLYCGPGRPLVLFLDDLQWADAASLKLLPEILKEVSYLLVIGAYRDTGLPPEHPLLAAVDECRRAAVRVQCVTLAPLGPEQVSEFLRDLFHAEPSQYGEGFAALSNLLLAKTDGNPLSLHQFVKALYAANIIHFDSERRRWIWDLEQIQACRITENISELMAERIIQLSPDIQAVLTLAAAVGPRFESDILLKLLPEQTADQVRHALWVGAQQGLILLAVTTQSDCGIEPGFRSASTWAARRQATALHHLRGRTEERDKPFELHGFGLEAEGFQFAHDRVQQAAYSLIPQGQLAALHLRIGQLLLHQIEGAQSGAGLYEALEHLNKAEMLLASIEEREALARLNLRAVRKARESNAYASALDYCTYAINLLPPDSWSGFPELTYVLYKEQADLCYLNNRLEEAREILGRMLNQPLPTTQRAELYEILLHILTRMQQYTEAFAIAAKALDCFGESLPARDEMEHYRAESAKVHALLGGRTIASLLDIPPNSSPEKLVLMRIVSGLIPLIYQARPALFPWACAKLISLSLAYGNAAPSSYGYCLHGLTLGSLAGDYRSGHEFMLLGIALAERSQDLSAQCIAHHVFVAGGLWRASIRSTEEHAKEGFRCGLESGNYFYANYTHLWHSANLHFMGLPLPALRSRLESYLPFSEKTRDTLTIDALRGGLIIADLLEYGFTGEKSLELTARDSLHTATLEAPAAPMGRCLFAILKLEVLYLYQRQPEALAAAASIRESLVTVQATTPIAHFCFYESLVLARQCRGEAHPLTGEQAACLRQNLLQLELWAQNCPENFLGKYKLVCAESARISGDVLGAMKLYDEAIEAAHASGFGKEAAIACELAALFYISLGRSRAARAYIRESSACYGEWGAHAKVAQLQADHPEAQVIPPQAAKPTSLTPLTAGMDLVSIMKASQALAGEVRWSCLLEKLLLVLVENAGAEKGIYLETIEDAVRLRAEAIGGVVTHLPETALDETSNLPATLVRYVARTGQTVASDHLAQDPVYGADPYAVAHAIKSVMCFPIRSKGVVCGVVYLENNLNTGVFTPQRLGVLQLLAGQAAVSMENARLFDQLLKEKTFTETALNAQLDVFFIFEPKIGKAVRWNNAARAVSGYSDTEIAQLRVPEDYFSGEDIDTVRAALAKVDKEGHAHFQATLNAKAGRRISMEYFASRLGDETNPDRYIIAVGRDITDRLKLEDHLRQGQKMEALGSFAGGIAHDFNNLLAVILPNIDLALETTAQCSEPHQFLVTSRDASLRAKELVKQIMLFTRQTPTEKGLLELPRFVRDFLKLLRSVMPTSIEFLEDIEPLPDLVLASQTQLNQILLNLCSNARQAMRDAGTLAIRVHKKHITLADARLLSDIKPGNYLTVSVSDNGSGMPPEVLSRIFDPFFTTKPAGQGTGLGLSVVYGIVKSHEGTITATSQEGKGSVFTVYLPCLVPPIASGPASAGSEALEAPVPKGTERILLVDDQPSIVVVTQRVLRFLGYTVTATSSPRQALALFRASPESFDLVITDQTMPELTGYELATQIQAIRPETPIILSTGRIEPLDESAVDRPRIAMLLLKPYTKESLAEAVRGVLRG
jgi:PAS domain S-box-containing protein